MGTKIENRFSVLEPKIGFSVFDSHP